MRPQAEATPRPDPLKLRENPCLIQNFKINYRKNVGYNSADIMQTIEKAIAFVIFPDKTRAEMRIWILLVLLT